jgi:hypothetical protein
MTEAEWLACEDPYPMLDSVPVIVGERKLQLLAVACCRRVRSLNASLTLSMAIAAAEQLADGEDTLNELLRLRSAAQSVGHPGVWAYHEPAARIARAVWMLPRNRDDEYVNQVRVVVRETCDDERSKSTAADLLRDIIGNPFRPVVFDPAWRTDTALSLARTTYEYRDFRAMPILADAFQDAGCDNDDILNHCRSPGPHVRGCWVVDRLLGKE